MWVDAAGALVGSVPEWADSTGAIWAVDLETGAAKPVSAFAFFGSAGCSGVEYVGTVAVPSGYAFETTPGGTVRVRDTTTQAISRPMMAQQFATCSNSSAPYQQAPSVPLASARTITRPAAPFTGPLHRERR